MSIDELSKRIIAGTSKVVTLDIERLPGRACVNYRGLTIEGDFWDLSGWKDTIKRRIRPDEVTEWPRTITCAWQVYGRDKVEFAAVWQHSDFHTKLWNLLDTADVIVGHNLRAFDRKHIQGELIVAGYAPPKPLKTVDTLTEARRQFAFESNQLGSLCDRLGVPTKQGHYSSATAKAAVAGNREAQAELREYNKADVVATEALYDRMRPWMTTHPHLKGIGDQRACNKCGSTDLELLAETYLAVVLEYALYRCGNCGGHVRAGHVKRIASTRGV